MQDTASQVMNTYSTSSHAKTTVRLVLGLSRIKAVPADTTERTRYPRFGRNGVYVSPYEIRN